MKHLDGIYTKKSVCMLNIRDKIQSKPTCVQGRGGDINKQKSSKQNKIEINIIIFKKCRPFHFVKNKTKQKAAKLYATIFHEAKVCWR